MGKKTQSSKRKAQIGKKTGVDLPAGWLRQWEKNLASVQRDLGRMGKRLAPMLKRKSDAELLANSIEDLQRRIEFVRKPLKVFGK